jgi:hypothetical protein
MPGVGVPRQPPPPPSCRWGQTPPHLPGPTAVPGASIIAEATAPGAVLGPAGTSTMGQLGHRADRTLSKGHSVGLGLAFQPNGPTQTDTKEASGLVVLSHIGPGQIVLEPGGPFGHL